MDKTITFNELRKIKDQLPSGSMRQIADKLDLNEETVRNYFGGRNFDEGQSVGIHFEQGPDGGIVKFDLEAKKTLDSLDKSGKLDELKNLGLNPASISFSFRMVDLPAWLKCLRSLLLSLSWLSILTKALGSLLLFF